MLAALLTSACGAREGLRDDLPPAAAPTDASVSRDASARRCRAPRLRPDFNGDGVGDLAFGTSEGASVYLGSRRAISPTPASLVAFAPTAPSGSSSVTYAGDVNGDGRGDLVVYRRADIPVEPPGPARHGLAEVHLGTPAGVDPRAHAVLLAPTGSTETFPSNVFGAGDVNGDGFDDLVAGSLRSDGVSVFLGGAAGTNPVASMRVQLGMPSSADATWFARGLGDFNDDGFDDVAVAGEVEARIFFGSPGGLSMDRSALVDTDRAGYVGPYLDGVGDLDADGCPDAMLLRFSRSGGGMYFVAGGSDLVALVPWAPRLPSGELARFNGASDFAPAHDLDGDGVDDVFVTGTCLSSASPCPDRPPREQYFVRGHADSTPAPATIDARADGVAVVSVGELTGDGRTEVATIVRASNTVRVHTWGARGPSATPIATLTVRTGVTLGTSITGTVL